MGESYPHAWGEINAEGIHGNAIIPLFPSMTADGCGQPEDFSGNPEGLPCFSVSDLFRGFCDQDLRVQPINPPFKAIYGGFRPLFHDPADGCGGFGQEFAGFLGLALLVAGHGEERADTSQPRDVLGVVTQG